MSLLFGKLTLAFVGFQEVVNNLHSSNQTVAEEAQKNFGPSATIFRHEASKDALYLTIIG